MSIALHSSANLDIYAASIDTSLVLPLASSPICAGFPSPALDFIDLSIDLNKQLIRHPASTFYGRVKGNSMKDAGIHDGDLLVIDKSLDATDGKIAVCYIDGEFTVKRIQRTQNGCLLLAANPDYKPIPVGPENDFLIWGIVIHVIKSF